MLDHTPSLKCLNIAFPWKYMMLLQLLPYLLSTFHQETD